MTRKPKPKNFKPKKDFPKGHKHRGKPRCQAWSPNNGRQCLGFAMRGKQVCRVHGGKSLSGVDSPAWIHGGYSSVLPRGLHDLYETMLRDTELLNLRHEIVLVKVRLHQLVSRIESGETDSLWNKLNIQLDVFEAANRAGRLDEANRVLKEVLDTVRTGDTDTKVWVEIVSCLEVYRRLVESERKRLVEMQVMISAEEVAALMEYVSGVVRSKVKDKSVLAEIANELRVEVFRRNGSSNRPLLGVEDSTTYD